MMFKIIFPQFLYDVSDRRIEEEVRFNLVLKWSVGLAVDEPPPSSSRLTCFRNRLGEELFTNIFNPIVEITSGNGLLSDRLSIEDSTELRDLYDLQNGKILVGEEFWNFVASDSIYDEPLDIFQEVGEQLRSEIDKKFTEFKGI